MKEKHTYHNTEASGGLPEALRANPYRVPDGYFKSLHLRTIIKCRDTENIGSSLGVPAGYFEQLADSITAKVAEQTLRASVSGSGFSVPQGYFNDAEQVLMAAAKIDAADTGFTVPAHYFDTLSHRIGARTHQATAHVRKLRRPTWLGYAAAAGIAVVLGLVTMLNITNDSSGGASPLASVSDEQIVDYLELYGPPNDMMYISEQLDDVDGRSLGEGISDEDIEAYLNHTL